MAYKFRTDLGMDALPSVSNPSLMTEITRAGIQSTYRKSTGVQLDPVVPRPITFNPSSSSALPQWTSITPASQPPAPTPVAVPSISMPPVPSKPVPVVSSSSDPMMLLQSIADARPSVRTELENLKRLSTLGTTSSNTLPTSTSLDALSAKLDPRTIAYMNTGSGQDPSIATTLPTMPMETTPVTVANSLPLSDSMREVTRQMDLLKNTSTQLRTLRPIDRFLDKSSESVMEYSGVVDSHRHTLSRKERAKIQTTIDEDKVHRVYDQYSQVMDRHFLSLFKSMDTVVELSSLYPIREVYGRLLKQLHPVVKQYLYVTLRCIVDTASLGLMVGDTTKRSNAFFRACQTMFARMTPTDQSFALAKLGDHPQAGLVALEELVLVWCDTCMAYSAIGFQHLDDHGLKFPRATKELFERARHHAYEWYFEVTNHPDRLGSFRKGSWKVKFLPSIAYHPVMVRTATHSGFMMDVV